MSVFRNTSNLWLSATTSDCFENSSIGSASQSNSAENVVYNTDYSFLKLFEALHIIGNNTTSVDDIIAAISKCWTKKEFANILFCGIKAQFKATNDFKFISKLHFSLKNELFNTNTSDNNKENKCKTRIRNQTNTIDQSDYNYNHTFGIQGILCKMFQFLDFESFISCHKVNVQWLYACYQPSSVYNLNISNVFTNDYKHPAFRNILRFKYISSLNIFCGENCINGKKFAPNIEYLSDLQEFKRISRIKIFGDEKHISSIMENVIENNKNNLKCIQISRNGQCLAKFESIPYFPKLNSLHLSHMPLRNMRHASETIKLEACKLYISFFNNLANNCDLSKVKRLYLDQCMQIEMDKNHESYQSDKRIRTAIIKGLITNSQLLNQVAKKLGELECLQVFDSGFLGPNDCHVSDIVLKLLISLNENAKTRKNLKYLDIIFDTRSFLESVESILKTKQRNGFQLNNLRDVSLNLESQSRYMQGHYYCHFDATTCCWAWKIISSIFCNSGENDKNNNNDNNNNNNNNHNNSKDNTSNNNSLDTDEISNRLESKESSQKQLQQQDESKIERLTLKGWVESGIGISTVDIFDCINNANIPNLNYLSLNNGTIWPHNHGSYISSLQGLIKAMKCIDQFMNKYGINLLFSNLDTTVTQQLQKQLIFTVQIDKSESRGWMTGNKPSIALLNQVFCILLRWRENLSINIKIEFNVVHRNSYQVIGDFKYPFRIVQALLTILRQKEIESMINDLNDTYFVPPCYGINGRQLARSGNCYSNRFIICQDVSVGVMIGDHLNQRSSVTVYSMDIQVDGDDNFKEIIDLV